MFSNWFMHVYKKAFMVPTHRQTEFKKMVELTSAQITEVYECYSLKMMMFCVAGPYDSLELICEKTKNDSNVHMFYKSVVLEDEES